MWQNENKQALKAFMDGDEVEAIERWQKTLAVAEEERAAPCFELGQVNYYLGKVLCDRNFDDAGIPHLQKAIEIITATDSGHEQLTKAKYDLACAFRRLNEEGKATALFQDALDLNDSYNWIPLKDAIKNLNKDKLVSELNGDELQRLCNELGVDPKTNNSCLNDLLHLYYNDEKIGKRRADHDKFFSAPVDNYDLENVVDSLSNLIGKTGKIKMVGAETFTGQEDVFSLELLVDGEHSFYQEVSSVDDLFDVFNEILRDMKSKSRFQRLVDGKNARSSYFLLKESILEKLEKSNTLRFIDIAQYDD